MKTHTLLFCLFLILASVLTPVLNANPAIQSSTSVSRGMYHWSPSDELDVDEVAQGVFVANHKAPVSSNSLVVFGHGGTCLYIDTPWTPAAMQTLMDWVVNSMGDMRYPSRSTRTFIWIGLAATRA